MTKLTIKAEGIKGTTFEADTYAVLRTLDFYAVNPQAICYYKNRQGWQNLSAEVAKRYAHVIGGCERVIIAVLPKSAIKNIEHLPADFVAPICPCCKAETSIHTIQVYRPRFDKDPRVELHCETIGCSMYKRTGTAGNLENIWQSIGCPEETRV